MTTSSSLYPTLKAYVSPARLQPYELATNGDPGAALALYEWNIAVSGAFFEDLGTFEVLLRNAIDMRLRGRFQGVKGAQPWYDQVRLQDRARDRLNDAKSRVIANGGGPPPQDKVVAELTFGFWRYLLSSYYAATIWPIVRNALHDHAGQRVDRVRAEHAVIRLYELRNRIAHHEPIFSDRLNDLYTLLLEASGWVCSDVRDWMAERSRVPAVLAAKP
jgi:hypothetical protein